MGAYVKPFYAQAAAPLARDTSAGNGDAHEIWGLSYSSGTTADVVVSICLYDGQLNNCLTTDHMNDCDVAVFAVYGGTLTGAQGYIASGTGQHFSMVIPVGAVAIGGGRATDQSASTWTGHSESRSVEPAIS